LKRAFSISTKPSVMFSMITTIMKKE
jgi:hypothetical protein